MFWAFICTMPRRRRITRSSKISEENERKRKFSNFDRKRGNFFQIFCLHFRTSMITQSAFTTGATATDFQVLLEHRTTFIQQFKEFGQAHFTFHHHRKHFYHCMQTHSISTHSTSPANKKQLSSQRVVTWLCCGSCNSYTEFSKWMWFTWKGMCCWLLF